MVGGLETFRGNRGQMTQESGSIHQRDAQTMAGGSRQRAQRGAKPLPGVGEQSLPRDEALSAAKRRLLGKREKELGSTHSLW